MTSLSLTSGELYEIINLLCDKGESAESNEDLLLANYYCKIAEQFATICEKMSELPGEERVANLVLTMN
jgi:hypothetical protein